MRRRADIDSYWLIKYSINTERSRAAAICMAPDNRQRSYHASSTTADHGETHNYNMTEIGLLDINTHNMTQ